MMRNLLNLLNRKSVLYKYLYTYCGLVLVVCAVLGAVLFSYAANEAQEVSQEAIRKRLQIVADDLSTQNEIMQEVVYSLSFDPSYWPSFLRQDKYYEFEMLKDFKKYLKYSPIYDDCYLLYKDEENYYIASNSSKSPALPFCEYTLGIHNKEEAKKVHDYVMSVTQNDILVYKDGSALFLYPLRFENKLRYEAVVIFRVTSALLNDRISAMGNTFDGNLTVSLNDKVLLGENRNAEPVDDSIEINGFEVKLYSVGDFDQIDAFRRTFYLVLSILTVLFVLVACFLAFESYKPINEIMIHFGSETIKNENEFVSIKRLMQENINAHSDSKEKLAENMKWLNRVRIINQEQMIKLAMTGNLYMAKTELLDEYEIFGENRRFSIACVQMGSKEVNSQIFEQIRELSDDDTTYMAVRLPEEEFFVIFISTKEPLESTDLNALLYALFDACDIPVKFRIGTAVSEIERLTDSFASALSQLKASSDDAVEPNNENDTSTVMQAIRSGDKVRAVAMLDRTVFGTNNQSYMYRLYIATVFINELKQMAKQNGLQLKSESLDLYLQYGNYDLMQKQLKEMVEELCEHFETRNKVSLHQTQQQVISYVHQHLKDYELSLNTAAKEMGITVKRLEQMIRLETNCTFREYVIIQRMELAKQLIATGESVASTGAAVCYNSIPYFIRTFKQYTGMTPTEYRKSLGASNEN